MSRHGQHSPETRALLLGLLLAPLLWYGIFVIEAGNFWLKIAVAAGILAGVSLWASPESLLKECRFRKRHLIIGLLSALFLYVVFLFGKIFLILFFHSAQASIESVYAPRQGLPGWGIALLLICITSPAEEIFWRGLVQRVLMKKFHPFPGCFLALTCYAGVHIVTLNVPLILAAGVAGFFWGIIYLQQKSLWPAMISHALWSVLVFLVLPFA